jgi:nucleotide-binding universal stress UspA family protein
MIVIKRILCPVDFSGASSAAISHAISLAKTYGAKIYLLHAVEPVISTVYDYGLYVDEVIKSMEKSSRREMKKLLAEVKKLHVIVEGEVRFGNVHDQIIQAIESLKPDLVVMGTHGHRGLDRWFIGSTTEGLLRHSPVPLLTVATQKKMSSSKPHIRRILVTTDFSDGTTDALEYAFSIAQKNQSHVTLLHVIHDLAADVSGKYRDPLVKGIGKQLEELVPAEAWSWCKVATRVETGIPYQVILRVLEKETIDLCVMNIHGKGMLDRALLGSTAERVVRAAKCPLLLVPPMKDGKPARKARPRKRAA